MLGILCWKPLTLWPCPFSRTELPRVGYFEIRAKLDVSGEIDIGQFDIQDACEFMTQSVGVGSHQREVPTYGME